MAGTWSITDSFPNFYSTSYLGQTGQRKYLPIINHVRGVPWWLSGKESIYQWRRLGLDPWVGKSPGGGMETHFSILTWRTPWTEEFGRLQPMGSQRVGHYWENEHASRQSQGRPLLVSLPPLPHAKSLHTENLIFFSPHCKAFPVSCLPWSLCQT